MDINPSKRMLITAGKDRMIKLWDTRTLKEIYTFKRHTKSIHGVKFMKNSS